MSWGSLRDAVDVTRAEEAERRAREEADADRPQATRALVLSSGGVDSTTCLAVAVDELGAENVTTVSVFYGQKHRRELEAADAVARYYGVAHRVLDLSEILKDSNSALMAGSNQDVKHASYAEQIAEDGEGPVSTYVPFRNGLMLSAVAALAMSIYPDEVTEIFLGAHADDAAGDAYPDCSPEFTDHMGAAIEIGTYGRVRLRAPFVDDNKAGVVKRGLELGVPYELTWSCYEGGDKPCGTCATCRDRIAAFRANGVEDPVEYGTPGRAGAGGAGSRLPRVEARSGAHRWAGAGVTSCPGRTTDRSD